MQTLRSKPFNHPNQPISRFHNWVSMLPTHRRTDSRNTNLSIFFFWKNRRLPRDDTPAVSRPLLSLGLFTRKKDNGWHMAAVTLTKQWSFFFWKHPPFGMILKIDGLFRCSDSCWHIPRCLRPFTFNYVSHIGDVENRCKDQCMITKYYDLKIAGRSFTIFQFLWWLHGDDDFWSPRVVNCWDSNRALSSRAIWVSGRVSISWIQPYT